MLIAHNILCETKKKVEFNKIVKKKKKKKYLKLDA